MSELKAFDVGLGRFTEDGSPCVVAFDADQNPRLLNEKVYLKSEADKVIAELKAQKAQAEDDCAYWKMSEWNAVNATHETEEYAMQLYKELRHQKYKRCLTMAGLCSSYRFAWSFIPEDDEVYKSNFYKKWELRWLELAEQFKEAK